MDLRPVEPCVPSSTLRGSSHATATEPRSSVCWAVSPMSELTFFLVLIYGSVLIFGALLAASNYNETPTRTEDRRNWARTLLLMPIWPLAATYLILRYGVPWTMHWLGKLFVDATRELEDS